MSTAVGGSFRNRIINGDMRIDQRNAGTAQTITAGTTPYTIDRWLVGAVGSNATGQRVVGSGNTQFNYQITGAASNTSIGFAQRIEAINCYDLAGQTVTLSCNLANSLLTSVTYSVAYPTVTDNYAATTAITFGTWTVNSTLTRYTAQIAIPSAATTGLQITLFATGQTSGTWTIGDVQLEKGSTATEFERRPIGTELALCQRYYYRQTKTSTASGVASAFAMLQLWSNAWHSLIQFPVTMRATPSFESSSAATFFFHSGGVGNAALTSINISGANVDSARLEGGTTYTANNGYAGQLAMANSSTAFLGFSAEL
jgi:hypothetical protein